MVETAMVLDRVRELVAGGQVGEALRIMQQGVREHPGDAALLESLAELYLKTMQPKQALRTAALARQGGVATHAIAIREGEAYLQLKSPQQAADAFQSVIREDEHSPRAWVGLGQCLLQTRELERATDCFAAALKADPDNVLAMHALAQCWSRQRRFRKAEALYQKLLERDPDNLQYRLHYADMLGQAGRNFEARRMAEPLLETPLATPAREVMIPLLLHDAEPAEAERLCRKGLREKPSDLRLKLWLGRALHLAGNREEAEKILSAVCRNPEAPPVAWSYLLSARKDGLSVEEVTRARAAIKRFQAPLRRALMHFALAEHFQHQQDYDAEFAEIVAGNRERLAVTDYNGTAEWSHARTVMDVFDRGRIDELSARGMPGQRPVFILTLPRSGSTLIEAMLGSHSAMTALGETTYLNGLLLDEQQHLGVDSDGLLRHLGDETIERLAPALADALRERAGGGETRIVEKGVSNYFVAGLLKCLFPDALFVELRRNVLDVCVGCYRQNFANQDFSLTLEGCADTYARYDALMTHWKSVMPESIHTVRYEDLVADAEGELRGVLEFIDEPWEDACLEYHKSEQAVATVSLNQVREKLFTRGIGRWRRYEAHLGPLFEALDSHGIAYQRGSDAGAS